MVTTCRKMLFIFSFDGEFTRAAAVSLYFDMGGAAPPAPAKTQVKRFELPDNVVGPDDEKRVLLLNIARKRRLASGNPGSVQGGVCFSSAQHEDEGLYINLSTFVAVGKEVFGSWHETFKVEEQLWTWSGLRGEESRKIPYRNCDEEVETGQRV